MIDAPFPKIGGTRETIRSRADDGDVHFCCHTGNPDEDVQALERPSPREVPAESKALWARAQGDRPRSRRRVGCLESDESRLSSAPPPPRRDLGSHPSFKAALIDRLPPPVFQNADRIVIEAMLVREADFREERVSASHELLCRAPQVP